MIDLKEAIFEAEERGVAIGHFNIATLEQFWGVVRALQEVKVPGIIGLSEGERGAIGVRQAKDLVESVREELGLSIFINADHSKSFESFRDAVNAHFDAAILDAADKPFEENIALTRKAVEYVMHHDTDTLVEGELGYIGSGSAVLDKVPEGAALDELLPTPEQAQEFVEKTGVDLLAPAVGNLHGILKGGGNPRLNIDLIRAIRESAGVPLVLHGGSGISDEDFRAAIEAGISVIHISTELRIAYRSALEASLKEASEELSPYKYLAPAVEAVKGKVVERLKLFNGIY